MLNMLRNGLEPVFGSPESCFSRQHRPVPQETYPDLHEQPKKPHVSSPVQQTPLHFWLPFGQSFSQVSSPSQCSSQYSPVPQHASPHCTRPALQVHL